MALAALVGLFEFYGLLRARGLAPLRATGLVLSAILFFEVAVPRRPPVAALAPGRARRC